MKRVEETEHLSWFNFRLKISFSNTLVDPDPEKYFPMFLMTKKVISVEVGSLLYAIKTP